MRMSAAVIAAVLSFATGGPLRCPCHFAQLVRGMDRNVDCRTADEDHGCPCHSHRESDKSPSHERGGVPVKPCEHGPGIDIAASVTTGDRRVVDHDSFDGPGLTSNVNARSSQADGLNGRMLLDCPDSPSESDQLKYCHSFRC